MRNHLLTFAIIGLSFAGARGEVWTYTDCVDYAKSHNISLQKTDLAEQTAAFDLEAAEAQWEPTLDFATSQGFSNYPFGEGTKNSYSSSYGLNGGWTAWNGGIRENTIKRNRLQTEIAKVATRDALRTLESDLLQVYINILYAREAIGIYEEAVRLSKAQADRSQALMEGGRASKVDYAQLRSQYEQDCYSLVEARGLYDTRRMELKKLLELGLSTDIEVADVEWSAEQVMAELPPMEESYTLALQNDVEIEGLNLEKEGTAIDIDIAKAGNSPTISVNAGVGMGYNTPGSFFKGMKRSFGESVGLTLSIPILDNKKTKTAVAKARIQQLNAELDIDQRRTDLSQLIESWYIDTRSAQARFTAAQQKVEAALSSCELTDEQFRLGLVNPVELMTAHNGLIEARYSLLQAKYMAMLGQRMIHYYRTTEASLQ